MKTFMIMSLALVAAACAEPKKDYDAMQRCQDLGYQSGSPAYDDCVKEEKASRMLRRQRQEFEQMKKDQEDWKIRRY